MKLRDRITLMPTGVKLALMAGVILVASAVPVGAYLAGPSVGSGVEGRPALVVSSDIDRYKQGSPARVFLQWWRELQFERVHGAVKYLDPTLGISAKSLSTQYKRAGHAGLDFSVLEPVIEDTDIESTEASVYMFLKYETTSPGGEAVTHYWPASNDPIVFKLRRVNREWRLANNTFVERAVKAAENS